MRPINPSRLFDLSRENARDLSNFADVLRTGELFRYRDDGSVSFNTMLEAHFATYFNKDAAEEVFNVT